MSQAFLGLALSGTLLLSNPSEAGLHSIFSPTQICQWNWNGSSGILADNEGWWNVIGYGNSVSLLCSFPTISSDIHPGNIDYVVAMVVRGVNAAPVCAQLCFADRVSLNPADVKCGAQDCSSQGAGVREDLILDEPTTGTWDSNDLAFILLTLPSGASSWPGSRVKSFTVYKD